MPATTWNHDRRPGKNIVICCDGTGQSIPVAERPSKSNVLRLFDLLVKDSRHQVCWYDPGIGTIPLLEHERRLTRSIRNVRDEWLGLGLMESVGKAYLHLAEHYVPGDRIFLFGFSRGAFTVRALAGMLRCTGLLRKENSNLLPNARDVFENMEDRLRQMGCRGENRPADQFDDAEDRLAEAIRRFSRPEHVRIAFLGVWDTVKAYGYLKPRGLPFTRNNETIDVVRHGIAIDERRSAFQVTGWCDRVVQLRGIEQDISEVWFTGDHSNVGGGHPDNGDRLAQTAFDWMLGEATHHGLLVDLDRYCETTTWPPNTRAPVDITPADLSRKLVFRLSDVVPRRELNNTYFPPARSWRFMKNTGARWPLNHKFPDDVVFKEQPHRPRQQFVRLHESVRDRCRSGAVPPTEGLLRLLGQVKLAELEAQRTGTPATLTIEWASTKQPIHWRQLVETRDHNVTAVERHE